VRKRAMITLPISIIFAVCIAASFFLMNIKPDTSHVSQAQKLAEYTKPAVVRIVDYAIVEWKFVNNDPDVDAYLHQLDYRTMIGASGSGAIISSNGYIVTNAHVVEYSKAEEKDIAHAAFEQLVAGVAEYFGVDFDIAYDYMIEYTLYTNVTRGLKVILPGGDVLDGEVKSYGAPVNQGKDVAVLKVEGKHLPTLPLGDSDNVQNQDDIWVIGYPAAAESNYLSPDSSLVSSMNAGHVSATSKKTEQGSPVIQIDAAATHGNSGGPVINKRGEMIGLLTFRGGTVNRQEVQRFNFVVPVNTVKEFVKQAGADQGQGSIDTLFREGLTLYWGGYYKDALAKFEAVERLYPGHSEIKRFITDSQQKSGQSKILWSTYKTAFLIFDGVALLLIIGLLVFTFACKPKQQTKAASADGPPVASADLNGDGKVHLQDVLLALQQQQQQTDDSKKKESP